MRPSPNSPGVARLDHCSLFLERGAAEGQWVLEARAWGHLATESVHEWHLFAAAPLICLTFVRTRRRSDLLGQRRPRYARARRTVRGPTDTTLVVQGRSWVYELVRWRRGFGE